ncbi:MAG: hypothetical protein ACRD1K_17470 [Acidimicrobiales bacterium]
MARESYSGDAMMAAVLLAQCADPADCDIPSSLPWYFSLALFAVWAAMVAGICVLVFWMLRARAERRRATPCSRGNGGRFPPAISSGTRPGGREGDR